MIKMSVFDKSMINRLSTHSKMSFREEAVKYFSRTSRSSGQSRSICFTVNTASHFVHVGVGDLQEVSKSVSSESDQFSTCLWLLHHGVNPGYYGRICQQLDRLHKACYLQIHIYINISVQLHFVVCRQGHARPCKSFAVLRRVRNCQRYYYYYYYYSTVPDIRPFFKAECGNTRFKLGWRQFHASNR